jgi:DNA-binding PadR family transcriptional regulator
VLDDVYKGLRPSCAAVVLRQLQRAAGEPRLVTELQTETLRLTDGRLGTSRGGFDKLMTKLVSDGLVVEVPVRVTARRVRRGFVITTAGQELIRRTLADLAQGLGLGDPENPYALVVDEGEART